MPAGLIGTGGRIQQVHGVNEQQDFLKRVQDHDSNRCTDSPSRAGWQVTGSPPLRYERGELQKIQRDCERFHRYLHGMAGY